METLYKYLDGERVDVLRDRRLRFTPPDQFNDPWEAYPSLGAFLTPKGVDVLAAEILGRMDAEGSPEIVQGATAEAIKVLEATGIVVGPAIRSWLELEVRNQIPAVRPLVAPLAQRMFGAADGRVKQQFALSGLRHLSEHVGILCLSEDPANLLMWSHYASSHTGFAMGFNATHPFFDRRASDHDLIRRAKKVRYSLQRPAFKGFDGVPTQEEIAELADLALMVKAQDWAYEREWRMVLELSAADEVLRKGERVFHLFNYPISAVDSVVLGCRMPDRTRETIVEQLAAADASHIRIREAAQDPDDYRLQLRDVA